ncbi:MFS domain-containing protein [Fusarium keratoplasticum]|nr:MFS domain-containing protein [Fusarium keratoplasticum]
MVGLVGWQNEVKKQLAAKNFKPETRLKLLPHAAIVFPAGFFIYGWTAEYKTHWMAPIIGLAVIGIGKLSSLFCE